MAGEMEKYLSRVGGSRTRDAADWARATGTRQETPQTRHYTHIIQYSILNNTATTSQPGVVTYVFSVYLALSPHSMVRNVF
jgi:hypothetical protein